MQIPRTRSFIYSFFFIILSWHPFVMLDGIPLSPAPQPLTSLKILHIIVYAAWAFVFVVVVVAGVIALRNIRNSFKRSTQR